MGTPVTFNGTSYTVPANRERQWGTQVSNLLLSLGNNALSKAGGTFTLTDDVNFGTSFGILAPYFTSTTASAASSGVVRLALTDSIKWGALALGIAASRLQFDGVNVPTVSSTDTLTNKTLSGNTATNLVSGSGTLTLNTTGTITVPNATDTLVGKATTDVLTNKTLSGNIATNLVSGAATVTLPTTTSTLATLALAETLTNKTLTTPTVDVLIQDGQASAPANPSSGYYKQYISDADGKMHILDSSGNDTVVGSGSSGRNYLSDWYDGVKTLTITNSIGDTLSSSDRTADKTTWGSSSTTNITASNTSSTPLRQTYSILLDSQNSTTGFIETPLFTLDSVDLGKPISLSFDCSGSTTDNDYQVYVARYNSSNILQERIVVAGNASATSPYSGKIPTGTTQFNGFFIAGSTSTDQYSVRFVKHAVNIDVKIDSLYCGPQAVIQGAGITDWVSYTPTVGGGGSLAATITGRYRRVGDAMELRISVASVTAAGTGTSDLTFALPSGYTIDATKLPTGATGYTSNIVGTAETYSISAASKYDATNSVYPASTTTLSIVRPTTANRIQGQDVPITTGEIGIAASVPITGWSTNVTMLSKASSRYFYTSESFDAAGSTTVEGLGGQQTTNLTANRDKSVTVPNLQPTDDVSLEISTDGKCFFKPDAGFPLLQDTTGSSLSGCGISSIVQSTGVITIRFNRYKQAANDDSPVTDWGTGLYWRLKVASGIGAGAMPISSRNIVGDTTGTTVPTGYIGEKFTFTTKAISAVTANWVASTTIGTLTKGTWLIYTNAYMSTAVSSTGGSWSLSTDGSNTNTNHVTDITSAYDPAWGTSTQGIVGTYNISADTVLYTKAISYGAARTITVSGFAIRIA